jgi:capsular exopolysaccharide synthesis family protein
MASIIYDQGDPVELHDSELYGYGGEQGGVAIGPLLRHLLAVLHRNIWLALAILATFLVLAAALTMMVTPKYTAESNIEIATRSDAVLGEKLDPNSQQISDQYQDEDRFLNTQISILTSRSLAERVAQKLNLFSDPRFFAAMQMKDNFKTEAERHNAVIGALMDGLKASLPAETRMAQIKFTSTDPKMSADIANAFASEFIQSNLQRRFDSSSYARSFVQQQLEQARARLEQSELDLNNYARQAGLIRARDPNNADNSNSSSGSGSSVTASSLLQLNQAANDAQAKRVAAEALWNAERAQPLLSSPAALASPTVQQLLQHRSDLQAQLQSARDRYLDSHPTVVRLTSELKNTDDQLNRAASQARNSVRVDYLAAQSAESSLRARVHELEGATLHEQDRSVRYNTLAREADTNRSIYDGLLQRYRELNASAGITSSNISVIDQADPPQQPSSPIFALNMAIALVIGTVVAIAVVLLKDQLDDRVRLPEEVPGKVGVNLLGVIPQVKDDDPAAAMLDPKSIISESYSALRSSLLYSTQQGLPHVLLVTSAQPSEGKTTTSYAIARGVALIGKRTLLIDADLRRPSVHRMVGLANKIGISDLLVGEKSIDDALQATDTDNLYVIPSGPVPPSPAELLASPRLASLLKALRDRFDFVVIDSAPVLGLADSPGLSALADGVLLVIEANRARGGQLKAAIRRLRQMKPVILGAILTKFNPEAAGNYYSTYYQYEYYQYRAEEGTTT